MNSAEIADFVDCIMYADCIVHWKKKVFWCLGMTWDGAVYCIEVHEENPEDRSFCRDLFRYESSSKDDCMKHFLEDKYWDGKSFYEVATEFEWD